MKTKQIEIRCIRCGDEYALITGVPRVGEAEVARATLNIPVDPMVQLLIDYVNDYCSTSCPFQQDGQPCGSCPHCELKQILHALPEEYK